MTTRPAPTSFRDGYADLRAQGVVTNAHWRTETEFAFRVGPHRNAAGELIHPYTAVLVQAEDGLERWVAGVGGWLDEWDAMQREERAA
jgi:hypothetical protein